MKLVKMTILVILTAIVSSTCGCVDVFRSFFPIHTKDTLVFKKELLGTWKKECLYDDSDIFSDEDPEICYENENPIEEKYIFHEKEKDGSYKVERISSEGKSTLLKVHLVKIGNNYFLDIVPYKKIKNPLSMGCIMIFHMIAKINFLDDLIEMCLLKKDLEWIDRTNMSSVEKDLITTGKTGKMSTNSSTEDVIKFLEKYGEYEEVFSKIYAQRFEKVD
jgi:hypothetical protein